MAHPIQQQSSVLIGQTFTGTYQGQYEIPETGTIRYTIDVDCNDPLNNVLKTIKLSLGAWRVWNGWTDRDHSYMGYDWDNRIFARNQPSDQSTQNGTFTITAVNMFKFNVPQYEFGIDIFVN